MKIKTVGVVGAGVIGTGVAQSLAQSGYQVLLLDVRRQALVEALDTIKQNLRFQSLFERKGSSRPASEVLRNIECAVQPESLGESDFVIENATENWDVKQDIYRRLDTICAEKCVFAANTSAISITRLASVTRRASRVIGTHFMNPVPIKRVVEVIRGYHTSDETLEITKGLLATMGKEWVIVSDSPGFVSNRVLMLAINEAIAIVDEQVAGAEDVDKIFRECFGHKMGPLETADLIGLDTILRSIEVLYDSFNDTKYRPSPLLRKMVYAGFHGRKSGRGFYSYANNQQS